MIDQDVTQHEWIVGPLTLSAQLVADEEAHPSEYECYDRADLDSFGSAWGFVGLVMRVTVTETRQELAHSSLWAIEHGLIGQTRANAWYELGNVAGEALDQLRSLRETLSSVQGVGALRELETLIEQA